MTKSTKNHTKGRKKEASFFFNQFMMTIDSCRVPHACSWENKDRELFYKNSFYKNHRRL